jgi:hypothetical protein
MAELLFIRPQEITSSTILSGNIDIDKYNFVILDVQLTVVEPLLGTELYDKITTDLENNALTGLYLTLFNDYVKPIVKHQTVAQYIEIASYMVDNGGIYKHTAENKEIVSKEEVQYLSQKSKALAQTYIKRFDKWICKNTLIEYKTFQDEVNATRSVNLMTGLHFGNSAQISKEQREWLK